MSPQHVPSINQLKVSLLLMIMSGLPVARHLYSCLCKQCTVDFQIVRYYCLFDVASVQWIPSSNQGTAKSLQVWQVERPDGKLHRIRDTTLKQLPKFDISISMSRCLEESALRSSWPWDVVRTRRHWPTKVRSLRCSIGLLVCIGVV